MKQPGEYLLHYPAAGEHVRDPAGDAEIVLQNHEVSFRISNQIRTDHGDVNVARHFDAAHFPAVVFAGVNNVAGHDAVFNDFALVIDIFEEEIQRRDPLRQSALDFFPFRRGDDPGQQIVRKNPLRAFVVSVDRKSDSLVEERLVSFVFAAS